MQNAQHPALSQSSSHTQRVTAIAEAVRSVPTAAIDSSPKKSPAASIVTVASLPFLEMTVSFAWPLCRKNTASAGPLVIESLLGRVMLHASSRPFGRQKLGRNQRDLR
jgi:hypothetical protein